jgi:AAHS family 4-hydroxybenzoate transporter-like MFS transporter
MPNDRDIDVGAVIESQRGRRFAAAILVWSCALMCVEGYDMQVAAYAAPAIIKAWGVSRAALGPVFGAGLFGYFVGAIALSDLADRFGRKRMILAGIWLFGVLTFLSAFAGSLEVLMALRFVAGIGLGGSIPSVIALNAEYTPQDRRATRIGVLFVGYTIGAALGGVVAARLMASFGWPVAFVLGGILPLVLSVGVVIGLPESARFLALRPGNGARLAAIVARLRPDLTVAPDARFVLREAPQAGFPMVQLFRDGRALATSLLWLAFVTSFLGHHFLTSWLPTVLAGDGLPIEHAVYAGALFQAGGAIGSIAIGRLVDRRGIAAIAIAFAIATPLVALIGVPHLPELGLMAIVGVAGLFVLGGQVGLNALAGTIYPTAVRSTGAGWALGIGRFGSILGPVIGGVLIGFDLPTWMLLICAAIPLACCAGAATGLRARTAPTGGATTGRYASA